MSDYIKLTLMVGHSISLLKINLVKSLESIQYRSETLKRFSITLFFFFGLCVLMCIHLGYLLSLFSHPGANHGPQAGTVQGRGKSSSDN